MRRSLVAGNWKMHGSRGANASLVSEILAAGHGDDGPEVLVCPPYPYLWEVGKALKDSGIALGAQDVCAEAVGAHTGEVSAAMLVDVGCTYAIVGHSERRALYGEDDQLVARKFVAAQREGLTPILCVGETLDEREAARTEQVVLRQLDAVIDVAGLDAFGKAVLAYEPVWAIGTGKTATAEQAQEMHAFIRSLIEESFDLETAERTRIQYGGSVKSGNIAGLMSMPDIDGALVGGASLEAGEFLKIVGLGPQ